MGVKGLWKLIQCSGVPVPLETLEHKIIAVDVSIWLHQAVRGFRGPGGATVANAHLLTLFHRICKLLFYRIRPVFVFDGGVPHLKKRTLASRKLRREVAAGKAKQVRERLLSNLLKSQAVRNALGRSGPTPSAVHVVRAKKVEKDMFELPPLPEEGKGLIKSEEEDSKTSIFKNCKIPNLHQFEFESENFKSLPLETQHEILSELQDTRKHNSWNSLNNMPQESTSFAEFQMGRLMKRRKFQSTLDDIRMEMQQKKAAEMEAEMFGALEKHVSLTQRIVSEDSAHSVFIKKINESKSQLSEEKEAFKEDKGKSPMKRKREEFEKDFLTELEKQGIVKSMFSSDSESDSDINDDYYSYGDSGCSEGSSQSEDVLNFDGKSLLKVVNNLLDNDGLSQDEILALIKQSKPDETEGKPSSKYDLPSTSGNAPGFVFNPDADSSDSDSDFIEVSEPSSPSALLKEKLEGDDASKKHSSVDNVKKVLETKNNSLWIKIMQQKLDDIVHVSKNRKSPKKALVDTRNIRVAKQLEKSKMENEKSKGISISVDLGVTSLKMDEDIFADVFGDGCANDAPHVELKPEKKKTHSNLEAITRNLARYSSIQEKLLPSTVMTKGINPTKEKNNEGTIITIMPVVKRSALPVNTSKMSGMSADMKKGENIEGVEDTGKAKEDSSVEWMQSSDDSDSEDLERKEAVPDLIPKGTSKLTTLAQRIAASAFEIDNEATFNVVELMSSSGESDLDDGESDWTQETKRNALAAKDLQEGMTRVENDNYQKRSNTVNSAVGHMKADTATNMNLKKLEIDAFPVENIQESDASVLSEESMEKSKFGEVPVNLIPLSQSSLDADVGEKEEVQELFSEQKYDGKPDTSEQKMKNVAENGTAKDERVKQKKGISMEESDKLEEVERSQLASEKESESVSVDTRTSGKTSESPERPLDYSEDELKRLEGELAEEQKALVAQAQKVERISTNLNDQMYGESQHLLQLFGIPYLVAPMEAEAQCGYLDAINLTAGTITDDSDIFLFGGTKVYRNFFNQTKHVEFFKTDNVAANLGLNRDKMITLALLTGSDYTEGIETVGSVSAMEILTEFPGEGIDCLYALKKWWNVAHKNVSAMYLSRVKQKMAVVHLPESFPAENIYKAYLEPEIDESRERFSWSVPNVDALRQFTMEKFGWNRAKADEILLPVMKKLGVKSTQMRIDSFFTNIRLVKDNQVHSKRMLEAIAKAKGEEPPSTREKSPLKRQRNPAQKEVAAKRCKLEEWNEPREETDHQVVNGEPTESQGKRSRRTLLIDPSESSSGPELSKEKTKAKVKATQKKDKQKKASGPSCSSREVDDEFVAPRKLTKEIMYEALHKKQTINQRVTEKEKMELKKKLAAELLKTNLVQSKKKR